MTIVRVEAFYSGHVQGVGFRQTCRQIASDYAVTGWVKNLDDGRVQLVAEGERLELERFLQDINQAMVRNIRQKTIDWQMEQGLTGPFKISY